MTREVIGHTKDGRPVYVDFEHSHAATHFADTPQLLGLVKEALPNLIPPDDYSRFEIDMGREVGTTDLVETEETDDVVYAKRPNRTKYSRFVKNKRPRPCTRITVELRKLEDGYELFTAYIGSITPPFPGGEFETPESRSFWSTHALAWGTQEVDPATVTTECPW